MTHDPAGNFRVKSTVFINYRNRWGWSALAYSARQLDPSVELSAFLVNSGARVLSGGGNAAKTPHVAPLAALVSALLPHPSIGPAERHLALFGAAMSQQLWPSPLPPAASSAAAKTTVCERRLMQQHVEAVLVSEGRWPGTHIPNLLLAVKARLEPYWHIQAGARTENTAASAGPVPQPLSRLCLNRIRSAVGVKRLAATATASTCGSPSTAGKKRLHEELRLPARMEDYLTLTRLPETMTPVPCSPQKTMTMISSMPKKRMNSMMMKNQKTDDVTTKEQQLGPASDAVLCSRKMTGHNECPLEDPLALRIRELLESSTKSV
jgi:hypothetical protein